jgi:hypothetical protein
MNSDLTVDFEADDRVRLSGRCIVTGEEYSVIVSLDGFLAYFVHGKHIGEAFPELPREEREFLISGTSPEGWRRLFARPRTRRRKAEYQ